MARFRPAANAFIGIIFLITATTSSEKNFGEATVQQLNTKIMAGDEVGQNPICNTENASEKASRRRCRGRSRRSGPAADGLEDRGALRSAAESDVLWGSQTATVDSQQLRQPRATAAEGETPSARAQSFVTPAPRVVTISPRVPVAHSIRSSGSGEIQNVIHIREQPSQPAHDPALAGTANVAPFFDAAGSRGPLSEGQFLQTDNIQGTGFSDQGPGFGLTGQGLNINGRAANFNGRGFDFRSQDPQFDGESSGPFGVVGAFNNRGPSFFNQPHVLLPQGAGLAGPVPLFYGPGPAFNGPSRFNSRGPEPDFRSRAPIVLQQPGVRGQTTRSRLDLALPPTTEPADGQTPKRLGNDAGIPFPTATSPEKSASEASGTERHLRGDKYRFGARGGEVLSPFGAPGPDQSSTRQENQPLGLPGDTFSPFGGAFSINGRGNDRRVSTVNSVSDRLLPFGPSLDTARLSQNGHGLIRGNIEILFPQQFRQEPGVFLQDQRGFPDPGRFSQADVLLPDEDRLVPDKVRFPSTQNGLLPRGAVIPADRGWYSPDKDEARSAHSDFLHEDRQQLSGFDGSSQRRATSQSQGRTHTRENAFTAIPDLSQQTDRTSLKQPTAKQSDSILKQRPHSSRGLFPLNSDKFLYAKDGSVLTDDNREEQIRANKGSGKNTVPGKNKSLGHVGLRSDLASSTPRQVFFSQVQNSVVEDTRDNSRVAADLGRDTFQNGPTQGELRSNRDRPIQEHRSLTPGLPPHFSLDQGRFLEDNGRYLEDYGRFPSDDRIFQANRDANFADQGRFLPNRNVFAQEQDFFEPIPNGFVPRQGEFRGNHDPFQESENQFSADPNRGFINLQNNSPDRGRFVPNQDSFFHDQGDISRGQNQFPHEDKFQQTIPQFRDRSRFQQHRDRVEQSQNSQSSSGNRFHLRGSGFFDFEKVSQHNDNESNRDGNGPYQEFHGFDSFEEVPQIHDPGLSPKNRFKPHVNQFQLLPVSGQPPLKRPSNPGRIDFNTPSAGSHRDTEPIDEPLENEVSTAPPPHITTPLPQAMIDSMDKVERLTDVKSQPASNVASSGSVRSGDTRRRPNRRRRPLRRRPTPRGHVTTARPTGPTTHPKRNETASTFVPLRRVLPGGHTSAVIINHRAPGGRRRKVGARRRFGRRRSTTTAKPEAATGSSDTTSDTSVANTPTANGLTDGTDTTPPSVSDRRKGSRRRQLLAGFRRRPRLRKRPRIKKPTETPSGRGFERKTDAASATTLERPQIVTKQDSDEAASGGGLTTEGSQPDPTPLRPDGSRRRRLSLGSQRRLRARQNATRGRNGSLAGSPGDPSGDSSLLVTEAAADPPTSRPGRRRYRDGDRAQARQPGSDSVPSGGLEADTWLDGTTVPSTDSRPRRPRPGSRRPPARGSARRRFRPGQRKTSDAEERAERPTGMPADHQRGSDVARGTFDGRPAVQDSVQNDFGGAVSLELQEHTRVNTDLEGQQIRQNRPSEPTLRQNGFFDLVANGLSPSLTNPSGSQRHGLRSQDRTKLGHSTFSPLYATPGTGDVGLFSHLDDFTTERSAVATIPRPVTAETWTDWLSASSRRRARPPPDSLTTSGTPVTGRSAGVGPVTIAWSGLDAASAEPTTPSWTELTTARSIYPGQSRGTISPPERVFWRRPAQRPSTSLSDMLSGRHRPKAYQQTGDSQRSGNDRRPSVGQYEENQPRFKPPPVLVRETSAQTTEESTAAANGGGWRARPWTTSYEEAAARGAVSTVEEEDVSLDSINEMVVAKTTERPLTLAQANEEPRLPLQELFDNL